MDTFSDCDFLWTEASSEDSDSDNSITITVNKMNNSLHDEDSESGKSYKKKLQKQLFNGDTLNISQKVESLEKTRKRKIKVEKSDDSESPIKKRIKTEPESDIDISIQKKTLKHNSFNNTQNDSQESVHESFLNLKVKEEKMAFAIPTTKKKKKRNEIDHSSPEFNKEMEMSDSHTELRNSNGNCEYKFEETVNEESQKNSEMKRKKNKKKLKKYKDDISDIDSKEVIEELFSAEETVVEERKRKKKSKEKIKEESSKETSGEKDELNSKGVIEDLFSAEETVVEERNKRKKERKEKNKNESSKEISNEKNELDSKEVIEDLFDAEETVVEELKKKKKSKEKIKNECSEETNDEKHELDSKEIIEDLFSTEETVVEERKKRKKKKKEKIRNESSLKEANDEEDEVDCHFENKTTEKILIDSSSNNSEVNNSGKGTRNNSFSVNSDNNEYDTTMEMKTNKSNNNETLSFDMSALIQSRRTPRVSGVLAFEEDLNSEASNKNKQKKSSRIKNYINGNPNLKPMQPVINNNQTITEDDDIWIFNCPNDFDIKALEMRDVVLDKKSTKMKINGQTYESVLNENTDSVVICYVHDGEHVINNLPLKGTITLHKKIPKLNFNDIDHNTAVNDKIKFFSLPEIKCRHPLFGSHYKKAIKISKTVAERLMVADNLKEEDIEAEQIITKQSKKKEHTKKKKNIQMEIESKLSKTKFELESNEDITVNNKKKKRKHVTDNDEEELVHKKTKKLKHDANSAEVWESEKTIEENLFNF